MPRLLSVIAVAVLVLLGASIVAEASMAKDFVTWQLRYEKKYHARDELRKRFNVFREGYDRVAAMIAEGSESVGTDSPFMDISSDEFEKMFSLKSLGDILANEPTSNNTRAPEGWTQTAWEEFGMENMKKRAINKVKGTEIFDWSVATPQAWVYTPRNQGQCGSCWAFSTAAVVEYALQFTSGFRGYVSPQQLVDCVAGCSCAGGNAAPALTYVKAHGITSDAAYPYRANNGGCRTQGGWGYIRDWRHNAGEYGIMAHLVYTGPQVVYVYAGPTMQYYRSGTITAGNCGGVNINHAVQVTGWGEDQWRRNVWRIRNSWGTNWGQGGYFNLERGTNACGVGTHGGWGAW